MCIKFSNLSKAFLKDSYPLPNIDSLVDATLSYTILSFCDTFSSYNQILMWEGVHLKMTFITYEGVFYYKVMPFDLKKCKNHLPKNDK